MQTNKTLGKRQTAVVLLGIVFSAFLLADAKVHAQTAPDARPALAPPSISLSPSVIMLEGKLGQSTAQEVHLSNNTPIPLSFDLLAMDLVTRDGKRVLVSAGETPQGIAATAIFSMRSVTVKPGETANVNVTLTVPDQTAVRAVVIFFKGTDRISVTKKAQGNASLGALVTFTLNKNFQVEGSPAVITPQMATANAVIAKPFTNTGSDPVILNGVAAILTDAGKLVTKASFDSTRLLPGEHLELKTEIPVELKAGHYRAFTSVICAEKTITDSAEFVVD
jgi:hypothetical protein